MENKTLFFKNNCFILIYLLLLSFLTYYLSILTIPLTSYARSNLAPEGVNSEPAAATGYFTELFNTFSSLPEGSRKSVNNNFFKYSQQDLSNKNYLKSPSGGKLTDRTVQFLIDYFDKHTFPEISSLSDLYKQLTILESDLVHVQIIPENSVLPGDNCISSKDCLKGLPCSDISTTEDAVGQKRDNMSCSSGKECRSGYCDSKKFCAPNRVCLQLIAPNQECDRTDPVRRFCDNSKNLNAALYRCVSLVDYTLSDYSDRLKELSNDSAKGGISSSTSSSNSKSSSSSASTAKKSSSNPLLSKGLKWSCKKTGDDCSNDEECCDHNCINNNGKRECRAKQICSNCAGPGEPFEGRDCCEYLYKDTDNNICIKDDPMVIIQFTPLKTSYLKDSKPLWHSALVKITELLFADANAQTNSTDYCVDAYPTACAYFPSKNQASCNDTAFNGQVVKPLFSMDYEKWLFAFAFIHTLEKVGAPTPSTEFSGANNIAIDLYAKKIKSKHWALGQIIRMYYELASQAFLIIREATYAYYRSCNCTDGGNAECLWSSDLAVMIKSVLLSSLIITHSIYNSVYNITKEPLMKDGTLDRYIYNVFNNAILSNSDKPAFVAYINTLKSRLAEIINCFNDLVDKVDTARTNPPIKADTLTCEFKDASNQKFYSTFAKRYSDIFNDIQMATPQAVSFAALPQQISSNDFQGPADDLGGVKITFPDNTSIFHSEEWDDREDGKYGLSNRYACAPSGVFYNGNVCNRIHDGFIDDGRWPYSKDPKTNVFLDVVVKGGRTACGYTDYRTFQTPTFSLKTDIDIDHSDGLIYLNKFLKSFSRGGYLPVDIGFSGGTTQRNKVMAYLSGKLMAFNSLPAISLTPNPTPKIETQADYSSNVFLYIKKDLNNTQFNFNSDVAKCLREDIDWSSLPTPADADQYNATVTTAINAAPCSKNGLLQTPTANESEYTCHEGNNIGVPVNCSHFEKNMCAGCGSKLDFTCGCFSSDQECEDPEKGGNGRPFGYNAEGGKCASPVCKCTFSSMQGQFRVYKTCIKPNPICDNRQIPSAFCFDDLLNITQVNNIADQNVILVNPPIPNPDVNNDANMPAPTPIFDFDGMYFKAASFGGRAKKTIQNNFDQRFAAQTEQSFFNTIDSYDILNPINCSNTTPAPTYTRPTPLSTLATYQIPAITYTEFRNALTNRFDAIKKELKSNAFEYISASVKTEAGTPMVVYSTPTPFVDYMIQNHYIDVYKQGDNYRLFPPPNLAAYYSAIVILGTSWDPTYKALSKDYESSKDYSDDARRYIRGSGNDFKYNSNSNPPAVKSPSAVPVNTTIKNTSVSTSSHGSSGSLPNVLKTMSTGGNSNQISGNASTSGQASASADKWRAAVAARLQKWHNSVGKTDRGKLIVSLKQAVDDKITLGKGQGYLNSLMNPSSATNKAKSGIDAMPVSAPAGGNDNIATTSEANDERKENVEKNKIVKSSSTYTDSKSDSGSNSGSGLTDSISVNRDKGSFESSSSNNSALSGMEQKNILEAVNSKKYSNDNGDSLFQIVSKAYWRSGFKRILKSKDPKDLQIKIPFK